MGILSFVCCLINKYHFSLRGQDYIGVEDGTRGKRLSKKKCGALLSQEVSMAVECLHSILDPSQVFLFLYHCAGDLFINKQ